MKKQYFQTPNVVVSKPSDRTFAFTMRLTNFLLQIKAIKKTTQPTAMRTSMYALSMCGKLNLRD